ncbi:MAG TPA: M43 family zinc metalloprotease [Chitinophagaceae bacterium]
MKKHARKIIIGWTAMLSVHCLFAQKECASFEYQQQLIKANPPAEALFRAAENFAKLHQSERSSFDVGKIITIPVVVHILYHYPSENISDDVVESQMVALNRDYRKQNPDTTKIPSYFKVFAADCGIEFRLATVDSEGRATTGIIHKYSPVSLWTTDDKIKFSSQAGDDAWDTKSYLNIWVGNLETLLGYSSMPGSPTYKDGVVVNYGAFGITHNGNYDQGRTCVHEVGHWLGLHHLWGDALCGDDSVADTPKQETFTNGCPSGVRVSCSNGPNGDMYMDYMDFTNDDCLVMFTNGQKQKMQALFQPGGPRYSILFSNGLGVPTKAAIPPPDDEPQWLHVQVYPNPAANEITVNLAFDSRWVGNELIVLNELGQIEMKSIINSKIQTLNIHKLKPGIYFISAQKDKDKILQEFVKF